MSFSPKNMLNYILFRWTYNIVQCMMRYGMKFGSLFHRVTGVSSLNLARRLRGWRASFISGGRSANAPGTGGF
jgi:DNA-binding HxlR family transcriptional regulator